MFTDWKSAGSRGRQQRGRSNEVPDREAREMLTALAKIYEAEADRIQQKATDERAFH